MTDWNELKRLAREVTEGEVEWLDADEWRTVMAEDWADFVAACTPETILALIAENERLREEHDKSWRRNQMLEENMRAAEQYVVRYTWFRKQVEHSCPNLFAVYQNIGHDWIQVTDLDRAIDDAIEKEEP